MMSAFLVALQFVLVALVILRADLARAGMALAHPGYADYRARTRAILPFVL